MQTLTGRVKCLGVHESRGVRICCPGNASTFLFYCS